MRIEIRTLEKSANLLFSHIRDCGVEFVDIKDDFYWDIPRDKIYDPYEEPEESTLGQLSSDWEHTQKIGSREDDLLASDLVPLAALMRYLGHKISI